MKKTFILFLGLLSLITILTGCQGDGMFTKKYFNFVYVGAPEEYPAIFDSSSYLFSEDKKVRGPFMGMSAYTSWGYNGDAFGLRESPLMAGIYVRWYSVAEDKFYAGEQLFDSKFMQALKSKQFAKWIFFGDKLEPLKDTEYSISVAPNGYVAVWGKFNDDRYLLTTFYAKEVTEPDFDRFIRRSLAYSNVVSDTTRAEIYSDMLEVSKDTGFKQTIQKKAQGIMPNEQEYKIKTETRYHWQLKIAEPYKIERFRLWTVDKQDLNYNAYTIDAGFEPKFASAPTFFDLFVIEPKTKERYEIMVSIDDDVALNAFNQMVAKVGDKALIDYVIEVKEHAGDLDIQLFLRSKEIKINVLMDSEPTIRPYHNFLFGVKDNYL